MNTSKLVSFFQIFFLNIILEVLELNLLKSVHEGAEPPEV